MEHSTNHQNQVLEPGDNVDEGHAGWLERLLLLQAEARETLACMAKIQVAMLEQEAGVEHYLLALKEAEQREGVTADELEYREGELRACFHRARRRHERVQSALGPIVEEFDAIEPLPTPYAVATRQKAKDEVEEASMESFPASDPPSYNPGNA
ncbi:MAG: hypothetical protein H0U74_09265 [Bradymonadaceae bacterium]|nr:hypothetical protein [Lujinxingiaceae bacterium]